MARNVQSQPALRAQGLKQYKPESGERHPATRFGTDDVSTQKPLGAEDVMPL
jgi:hypothetical protein